MKNVLSIQEIFDLARDTLVKAGSNEVQSEAVADTISRAEQDGSASHGLFRLPGYFASLKSGKINQNPKPKLTNVTKAVLKCDGDRSYAPLVHKMYLDNLIKNAKEIGVSILSINRVAHFAALWPETETLAESGLVGIACTSYMPAAAPFGASEKLYGTNPISFAWPRNKDKPIVFDMATSSLALGDIQIAARDGHELPLGTGIDKEGNPTTDPNKILEGMLLPFGGYKGSHFSMMIEFLAGPLVGETTSFLTKENNLDDGGPPLGGELIIAMAPEIISDLDDWEKNSEPFINKLSNLNGVRIPGKRRHNNRETRNSVEVNSDLLQKIYSLK